MAVSAIGGSPGAYPVQGGQARQAFGQQQLSAEEQAEVRRLRQIDQQVRAHEQAHLSAAAGLAVGGANYQTVRGPDGRQYAVAGEVSIDVSAAQTPQQTIDKARRIQAAALAPADPSSQDRAVAAAAAQMLAQAQAELSREKQAELADRQDGGDSTGIGGQAGGSPGGGRDLSAYTNQEPAPPPVLSLFA
jgi:hypothetical protein